MSNKTFEVCMYDASEELKGFIAWAESHGGIDLTWAKGRAGNWIPSTSDGTLNFCTFLKRETELAWRAYANKK